ncbi:MAG: DUF983 domain-containing protein [Proteobacteria bacterium]|nr:DUF983 domain-containing protein [Pseudomonadota bacterium]MBW3616483.1 DUF983 domain-containing protein [Pseudomonadota bacterium]
MANRGASIWKAGLAGRCPRCGEGRLFAGFLKLEDRCDSCGLQLGQLNAADGPAFFAMSAVGIFVGFAALFVEMAYSPPIWVHLLIWFPLIAILSVGLLRPIKGVMVALTFRHRGFESSRDGG